MNNVNKYKTHTDARKFEKIKNSSWKEKVVYPYTITIRNSKGGAIWQSYNILNIKDGKETSNIVLTAFNNGYEDIRLEEFVSGQEETFPNWRKEVERDDKLIENKL
tara:strand:- start:1129 stop:1446 length:318 start_codon:yes stop_codon:yes gene_type:complete